MINSEYLKNEYYGLNWFACLDHKDEFNYGKEQCSNWSGLDYVLHLKYM